MTRALALSAVALALVACRKQGGPCGPGDAVSLAAPPGPAGFDADFSVKVRVSCPEARTGTVTWRQVSPPGGPPLVPTEDGFALRAHTPSLRDATGNPPPWGVVPLSPRTRGEVVLEATWRDGRGHEERHEARVAAAARSRGLPNLAVGARVYLGGAGWHLEAKPPGSAAALDVAGDATSFLADKSGDWRLVDGAGRPLTLKTGRYDETPLDCGRSGCHAALVTASAGSPMETVLAHGLSPSPHGHGALFGAGYPDCALACHATGEPGVADGGFVNVMGELGLASLGPRRWEAVPRALRRLGGVGCLACHGPTALPEASARWGILRSDVCATCHDAPPRYGHVAAWRETKMARADRDVTGTHRWCGRCHTTAGYLESLDPPAERNLSAKAVDRSPPLEAGPVGISCAACHSVHDHEAGRQIAQAPLLRRTRRLAVLADVTLPATAEKSAVCLNCHAPDGDGFMPGASAAALWLGRGGVDPRTDAPLNGSAPHANVAGGCIGCHRAGPAGLERGASHAFAVDRGVCASCHPRGLPGDDVRERAQRLWATWLPRDAVPPWAEGKPPHVLDGYFQRKTPRWRAIWNVLLVLEDPAAAAHNAPYARRLLEAAEKTLNGAGTPPGRP